MNVRSLRKAKGWTQLELAKRAGTSQSQISRFEYDADSLSQTLKRIASALGVSVLSLIEEEEVPIEEEEVPIEEEVTETSCWLG